MSSSTAFGSSSFGSSGLSSTTPDDAPSTDIGADGSGAGDVADNTGGLGELLGDFGGGLLGGVGNLLDNVLGALTGWL